MDLDRLIRFFHIAKDLFESNLNTLSQLDSALGDGDHGISMLKGFKGIEAVLSARTFSSLSELLSVAGRTFMKEVGGSCGPLFAAVFLQGAVAVNGKTSMETADFAAMLLGSVNSVMALGKAKPGEKTMLDALIPAAESLKKSAAENLDTSSALTLAAEAAARGAQETKDMLATKGRGRYQGKNSLGHLDAGAVSVSYLMRALAEA